MGCLIRPSQIDSLTRSQIMWEPTEEDEHFFDASYALHDDGKRSSVSPKAHCQGDCYLSDLKPIDTLDDDRNRPSRIRSPIKGIYPPDLVYPKSRYQFYEPPMPLCSERSALDALLVAPRELVSEAHKHDLSNADTFIEFDLDNFTIYLPGTNKFHAYELRSLHFLATRNHGQFVFNGILSYGATQRYVEGVPFDICSIGNYGIDDLDSVTDEIWLQSEINRKSNIFYRLRRPASEYARFHNTFLWTAQLSNLFVDFAQLRASLSVHDFRSDFFAWANRQHGNSCKFQAWFMQYNCQDFRGHVSSNVEFLHKEAVGLDWKLSKRPIWAELKDMTAIPYHKIKNTKTIVTPFIYELWNHMPFGHHLKAVHPVPTTVVDRHLKALSQVQLVVQSPLPGPKVALRSLAAVATIQVGDVIAVTKDTESMWKDETSRWKSADDCWYICVSLIQIKPDGTHEFDGNWMYRPSDTSCAIMKYPYDNELFVSDNCTCKSKSIEDHEILEIVPMRWHGKPTKHGRFCRQAYLGNERFVTLEDSHKFCKHTRKLEAPDHQFRKGQTVLAKPPKIRDELQLEPYEFAEYINEGGEIYAKVRRLARRSLFEKHCRPNELVYTDHFDQILANKIDRACLVRFYTEANVINNDIPAPYNRNGTGNAFFVTKRLVVRNGMEELKSIEEDIPQTMIEGFDPKSLPPRPILNGLDMFSGWGSLGRGLEEGGVMRNKWIVDLYDAAIHSYWANLDDPEGTKMFFGSVDDLLHQALLGNPQRSPLVPRRGDVHFLSAGSPCQGFSALNDRKNDEKGLKNQSLVASVAAYVDFYRPKYGVLENVIAISYGKRDKDVLSQLICSLVGMGYQVQQPFLLDAWNYGSPQSRSRLFVSFAAPGLEPIAHPEQSHSHPPNVAGQGRAIGKLANGAPFGERVHGPTPFEFVGAGQACSDLPATDGACMHIKHPDHVPARVLTDKHRQQISAIPKRPRGMNLMKAWNNGNGVMTREEKDLFVIGLNRRYEDDIIKGSKAWGRIHPKELFRTIIVSQRCEDLRMGTILHWDQNREITILEARRAQSVPDHELLVGSTAARWKLIGNGVDRSVSLALGLSLREAWLKSPLDAEHRYDEILQRASDPTRGQRRSLIQGFGDSSSEAETATRGLLCDDYSSHSTNTPLSSIVDSGVDEAAKVPLRKHTLEDAYDTASTSHFIPKKKTAKDTHLSSTFGSKTTETCLVAPIRGTFEDQHNVRPTAQIVIIQKQTAEEAEHPTTCRLSPGNRSTKASGVITPQKHPRKVFANGAMCTRLPSVMIGPLKISKSDYTAVSDVEDESEHDDKHAITIKEGVCSDRVPAEEDGGITWGRESNAMGGLTL